MFESKKAAMEMSVGTIVTIVLLVTVLVLGLVLVRTIFSGAKYNVDIINDKVTDQINQLFSEDNEMVVYLANQKATIKQGEDWGIAWAVKNLKTGRAEASKLSYDILISDPNIRDKCGINAQESESWIVTGKTESDISLNPGKTEYSIVRIQIPETAPLCTIRYRIETELDGEFYKSAFFDVEIKSK